MGGEGITEEDECAAATAAVIVFMRDESLPSPLSTFLASSIDRSVAIDEARFSSGVHRPPFAAGVPLLLLVTGGRASPFLSSFLSL
jgi:hypothetical protein